MPAINPKTKGRGARRVRSSSHLERRRAATPPATNDQQSDRLAALGEREIASFGECWLAEHRSIVESLAAGTVLAVDMETGIHVTGSNGLVAMDKFEASFGPRAIAWIHEVGVPISLGGGLWQLRLEA